MDGPFDFRIKCFFARVNDYAVVGVQHRQIKYIRIDIKENF